MKNEIKELGNDLGIPQETINNVLKMDFSPFKMMSSLNPVTIQELSEMSEDELKTLYSLCWRNGKPRCSCVGISDVRITKSKWSDRLNVSWSDDDGEPCVDGYMGSKINKLGDGEWEYGLYRLV
jgi:hypothetical protein